MRKTRTTAQTLSLPFRLIYLRYAGLVWGGVAIILLGLSIFSTEKFDLIRMQVADVTSPLLETASRPFVSLSENIKDVTGIGALRAENIRLAEENARLLEWYQNALKLEAENQGLRGFLNVKAEPERAYLTTRVIADTGGRFIQSFLIPSGRRDGVANGQAVITESGLIGRITDTGEKSARVLLITDLNSRIPVMVEETHHRAVLAGQNTEDTLILRHLPNESGVEIGARIVTSGHGGVLPPNIPVGVVSAVSEKNITVVPLSNMDRIHFVQVIATSEELIDGLFIEQGKR